MCNFVIWKVLLRYVNYSHKVLLPTGQIMYQISNFSMGKLHLAAIAHSRANFDT